MLKHLTPADLYGFALLVLHGGLHLAGWDHASDTERVQMWDRERVLMRTLHRTPARDPWGDPPS